jgi:hypothetical protein
LESPGIYSARLDRGTWALLRRRAKDQPVRIGGMGRSMTPFIREHDTVLLMPNSARPVAVGDVVLIDLGERGLALHRIVERRAGRYLLKGDGNESADGWFPRESILARACAILPADGTRRDLTRRREQVLARFLALASRRGGRLHRFASRAIRLARALSAPIVPPQN